VDFLAKTIIIRKSKTQAGQRMIPLNDDALSAVKSSIQPRINNGRAASGPLRFSRL
jgi:hypothetical protein